MLYFTYAEPLEIASVITICHLLMHQQGSTYCSHDLMMGWNNDFSIELFLKCFDYTRIKGYPTLKYYRELNILPQPNIVELIAN